MKMMEKDMTAWWITLALSMGCQIRGARRETLVVRDGRVLGRGDHSEADARLVHAVAQFVTGGGKFSRFTEHLNCTEHNGRCQLATGPYEFSELYSWMHGTGCYAPSDPRYLIERDGDKARVTLSNNRRVVTPFDADDKGVHALYEQLKLGGYHDWQGRGFSYRATVNERGQVVNEVVASPEGSTFKKYPFQFRVAKTGVGSDFQEALTAAFAAPETEVANMEY